MKLRAVHITGKELPFYSMGRSTLEGLMLDGFDVYLHEGDDDYRIYYNSASDSFHYVKNRAIYELDLQQLENS